MPADVKPYLVPADDTIVWEPWFLAADEGGWVPLPEEIDGWDPGTDLRIMRMVRVDTARLLRETGVEPSDVVVSTSWTSSSTGMTDSADPVPLGPDGVAVAEATLTGERLSGVLTVRSAVCLGRVPAAQQTGVAWIPGSVLRDDSTRMVLENRSSMFPVHEIDFAATRLSPYASWHLESSTDLLSPFYGVFRVLINSRDTELRSALARGAKDKRQQALLDELESGIAALLLEIGLNLREELGEREEWPPESVGDVFSRMLEVSELNLDATPTALDLPFLRTQLSGTVRSAGRGRVFR